jgi:hypothetical protein
MNRATVLGARPLASETLEDPTVVRDQDVERISVLEALLLTLNDPLAGARDIAWHVEQYPILRARIEARYRHLHGGRTLPRPTEQIATLGNRELEQLLLQLLEDIVTFHSERNAP